MKSISTLQRRLVSINVAHQRAGLDSPTGHRAVRQVWRGVRRTFGVAQRGKAPLLTDDVRAMVGHLDERPADIRDRALVLIMFGGAMRRSEVVGLNIEDVADTTDGLVVTIRRSKTDQEGAGATVGIPYGSDPGTCPVRAYRAHLAVSGITGGAVIRARRSGDRMSGRAAAAVVQRLAAGIGREASVIGAHSLRAGLITSAAKAGVPERRIMDHSRHKSIPVFRSYIRDVGLFEANAAAAVGL